MHKKTNGIRRETVLEAYKNASVFWKQNKKQKIHSGRLQKAKEACKAKRANATRSHLESFPSTQNA